MSEEVEAKVKAIFPEDVEVICISKNDYDRLYGDLTLENIELKEEIERLNNIINRIKSIYSSLCFSAPENDYIFIEQLGEVLQEIKGVDKE